MPELTLFVDAQYDRLLRGIQVQSYDIGHLFQKLRIARKLKGFWCDAVQIVSTPDIVNCGFADALAVCIVLQLQCVIPAGLVCRVASTMAAILSMG